MDLINKRNYSIAMKNEVYDLCQDKEEQWTHNYSLLVSPITMYRYTHGSKQT